MPLIYATTEDVKAQAPTHLLDDVDPKKITRLLRLASAVVGKATRAAIYNTEANGLPSDADKREAMRDATVYQLIAWVEAGVHEEILTNGATSQPSVSSSSINGSTVSFDNTQSAESRAHLLAGGLGVEALLILDEEGLLHGLPSIRY